MTTMQIKGGASAALRLRVKHQDPATEEWQYIESPEDLEGLELSAHLEDRMSGKVRWSHIIAPEEFSDGKFRVSLTPKETKTLSGGIYVFRFAIRRDEAITPEVYEGEAPTVEVLHWGAASCL